MIASAKIYSAAVVGLQAIVVEVEAYIGRSLPNIAIVGLPDTAVQEARERVRAAIKHSEYPFPKTRVTINLAPGNVRKIGSLYDLPVALAILLAADTLRPKIELHKTIIVGELALDGTLRPIPGALAAAMLAVEKGFHSIIVPIANAQEAALVASERLMVYAADSLTSVVRHAQGETTLPVVPPTNIPSFNRAQNIDFAFIHGQAHAKRALEVAAAGGHNIRLSGPPGSGKTLLARALSSILPPFARSELLEVTRIYSSAGQLPPGQAVVTERPFRSPHHTTSHVAMVGGGAAPRPGEITLAHRGVLFLDEFPEYPRQVLEALRQPLEDGVVSLARAAAAVTFPARFLLVAAENPCPCGFVADEPDRCTCTPAQLAHYQRRVSGPILDRIDLHVVVPRLSTNELSSQPIAESSVVIQARVTMARQRQVERFTGTKLLTNAEMNSSAVRRYCELDQKAVALLTAAVDRLQLSARSYFRTLKLARTIADLAQSDGITEAHLAEAIQYRSASTNPKLS